MRNPAVAGQFYAGNEENLKEQIAKCFTGAHGPGELPKVSRDGPRRIVGGISPHAGYMFSGMVAAHLYARIAEDGLPGSFVILARAWP